MTAQAIQIEYQRQARKRESLEVAWLHRVATYCAIIPALVGLFALSGYWLTQDDVFEFLGWLTLVAGSVIVVIGIIATLTSFIVAHRTQRLVPRSVRRAMVLLIVLALNYPLAVFCRYAGQWLMDHPYCTLVLSNNGNKQIKGGTLEFGSTDNPFDSIQPGKSVVVHRRLNDNDRLALVLQVDGKIQRMPVVDRGASPLRIDARPVHIDIGDQTAERKD